MSLCNFYVSYNNCVFIMITVAISLLCLINFICISFYSINILNLILFPLNNKDSTIQKIAAINNIISNHNYYKLIINNNNHYVIHVCNSLLILQT